MKISGYVYDYNGEVDEQGKACGIGYAKNETISFSFSGTFMDNRPWGISK